MQSQLSQLKGSVRGVCARRGRFLLRREAPSPAPQGLMGTGTLDC